MYLTNLIATILPFVLSAHGFSGYLANCTAGAYVYPESGPNNTTYLEIQADNCQNYQPPGAPPGFPVNCDIPANSCFANSNGTLIFLRNGNFTNSCTDVSITKKGVLSATCSKIGGKTQKTSIQTNNYIGYTGYGPNYSSCIRC